MQPTMAQVLNTLAHEIRTPLAVSQGYLKLYMDGHITAPEEQRRALQQAREALGMIAVLCADINKVTALAEAEAPSLIERLDVAALARDLEAAAELAPATWLNRAGGAGLVATNAPRDLVRAIVALIKPALAEHKHGPHQVELDVARGHMVIRAGSSADLDRLPATPDAADAIAINVTRGGHGLAVIWAVLVMDQHRIQIWRSAHSSAVIGFQIPLVPL